MQGADDASERLQWDAGSSAAACVGPVARHPRYSAAITPQGTHLTHWDTLISERCESGGQPGSPSSIPRVPLASASTYRDWPQLLEGDTCSIGLRPQSRLQLNKTGLGLCIQNLPSTTSRLELILSSVNLLPLPRLRFLYLTAASLLL